MCDEHDSNIINVLQIMRFQAKIDRKGVVEGKRGVVRFRREGGGGLVRERGE